jgi:hypothetical protein
MAKEKDIAREGTDQQPGASPPSPQRPYPRGWLKRFLWGLFGTFALLAVAMWGYNLYWDFAVAFPAINAIQSESDDAVMEAAADFMSPHIFSGYQPYTGFGPERAGKVEKSVRKIMSRGTDYLSAEVSFLAHSPSHYVSLFNELKIEGGMAPVHGDREVLMTVALRLDNAVHSGYVFSLHLTLVALLLGLVVFLYYRLRLWDRV